MPTVTEVPVNPVSDKEILEACLEMGLGSELTFTPKFEFAKHELAKLQFEILNSRKKMGAVSLRQYDDANGNKKIEAKCSIVGF